MHVSVAIVGFRNAGDIAHCLDALALSTHQDFEVVICENGGEAAYLELKEAMPVELAGGQKIQIIKADRNLGYAGGTNLCIHATATADAWWILNPDTLPDHDALAKMLERLQIGDCDAVGPKLQLMTGLVQFYGGRWQAWLGRPLAIGYGRSPNERIDKNRIEDRQNYLSGASMIVSRRFLELTGYMREDYFLYCEEVEWCLRAIRNGARLGFAPEAIVFHHSGKTMMGPNTPKKRRYLPVYLKERNRILLTKDHFPLLLPAVIVTGVPRLLYRSIAREGWRAFLYGFRGFWAGIVGERGVPKWLGGA